MNFISGFLLVYVFIYNSELHHLFSKPTLVFLGKVSFSVYLIHLPIISTFGIFLFQVSYAVGFGYVVSALSSSLFSIILIYIFGNYVHKYIDISSMKLIGNFERFLLKSKSKG